MQVHAAEAPCAALQPAGSTSLPHMWLWCAAEACSGSLDNKVLQSKSHTALLNSIQALSPDCLTLLPPCPEGSFSVLHLSHLPDCQAQLM